MKLKSKTLIWKQPERGVMPFDYAFYLHATGQELVRVRCTERKDDIYDEGRKCFSTDNGRTWSDWQPIVMSKQLPNGILRTMEGFFSHDPGTGRSIELILEGLFPLEKSDDSLAGMSCYYNKYRVYKTGSRKAIAEDLIVQKGFSKEHPTEKVWVGKNAMDAMPLIFTRGGRILLPLQITVLGPDGKLANLGGGFTWTEVQMLLGRWRGGGHIEWEGGASIRLGPEQSTRGAIEPALAEFPDGRILMVLRASNGWSKDPECRIPSYKWCCVSSDGGLTWTDPQPWQYSDGSAFFSPSSNPQLTKHSNGKVYFNGHITPENAKANGPRYPLVIGEVDPQSLMLIKESVITITTREPGEPESIQMHRVWQREDRETGEIVLYMTRYGTAPDGTYLGDAWEYRVEA